VETSCLDRQLYPFAGQEFEVDGARLHYVDEGSGRPVVFVHGTPTWSFLWRRQLRELASSHRVVAADNLGFGLSAKPAEADYSPAAHARRLGQLIDALELRDVTLVVHDFGGPIGLHYALKEPQNVRSLVLLNTWLWSNEGNRTVQATSRLFGGPLGRFLYLRMNFSARFLLPGAFADRSRLSPEVHAHYLGPFADASQRLAPWVLARELTRSNDWYDGLWSQRELLAGLPTMIVWGLKDRLMPAGHLQRWQEALPQAQVVRLPEVGHFPHEEAPEELNRHLRGFLVS